MDDAEDSKGNHDTCIDMLYKKVCSSLIFE